MDIPASVAGSLTIVLLVLLGIFLYPWLLRRRGGALVVGVSTIALAVLFYLFDRPSGVASSTSRVLAVVWALLPLISGLLVKYSQDKRLSR
jgi:lipopolysaccharide export LptBFGC system permease protein LptF